MDLLRRYMWLWVICGMIFVSVGISFIFFLINKCLSRRGHHRVSKLQRGLMFNVESNNYKESKFDGNIPSLPPRTQFLTGEAQSYENLAEPPAHEQNTNHYEQNVDDYEQSVDDYEQNVDDYEQNVDNYEQNVDDYEQPTPDYEQDAAEQFDYVQVDDEQEIVPPPPPPPLQYDGPDPANDDSEDYDDIGAEDGDQDDDDYDDLG